MKMKVTLNQNYFFRKLAAMFYDALILLAILMLATAIILPFHHQAISAHNRFFQSYLLIIMYGYFAISWRKGQQTIGMRVWRLQIISMNNQTISIKQTLLRFLGAILSFIFLGIGFIWSVIDKKKLTWHDHLSKTYVTKAGTRIED